jgi:hypothetical protein
LSYLRGEWQAGSTADTENGNVVLINYQSLNQTQMEKFMYLFRGGMAGEQAANVPAEHMQKWVNWMESLGKKGIMVGGEPLVPTGKQVNGSKKVVTDGPFIESKELVGGYLIVNAKDIDEAVEFSKDCPIFEVDGKLEVRPIQKMEL